MFDLYKIESRMDSFLELDEKSPLVSRSESEWSIGLISNSVQYDAAELAHEFNRKQTCFNFQQSLGYHEFYVAIHDHPSDMLFEVVPRNGMSISTMESQGISRYAHLEVEDYLLICSMLGLLQVLCISHLNHMIAEDFLHPNLPDCLLSPIKSKPMAALLFENPKLCSGCSDFYSYLGLEPEILGLVDVCKHVSI